ncbi:hypothetical protein VdG2_01823 [Verticillium dahliae VDG2]|nr:hypothetical protein VdG2_01823 [Verticillium dahliae VDG2]
MSRSIEQALLQLMPTHGTDLPPPLVELASALLAQSRHRASTLKAEEEQLRVLRTGEPITEENYLPVRAEVLALLARARQELVVGGGLDEDDAWEGWRAVRRRDFIAVTDEVTRRAFLQEDWYVGIRDLFASGAFDADEDEADMHEAGAEAQAQAQARGDEEGAGRLTKLTIRRADTMFQDRYDYLSETRRLDYRLWKEGLLQRIEQAESTAPDGMDVD